jgi:hypothetical protein
MLARRQILSAMAGLAMLAMPVSALAKPHHDTDKHGAYAWHDQGVHNGWNKHQRAEAYYTQPRVAPVWNSSSYYDHHEPRYWATPQQVGWHDSDAHRWNPNWDSNYRCDGDGDDCHWANNNYGPQYWQNNGGYDYGAPYSWYQAAPPGGMNLEQQRSWLIERRQRAMAIIAQMRARGDSRGPKRMIPIVNALDNKIASINRQLGYGRGYSGYAPSAYVPPSYAPAANYATPPLNSLLAGNYGGSPYGGNSYGGIPYGGIPYGGSPYGGSPYGGSPYGGSPYGGSSYYGNSGYANPTTQALVSMLPLLLGPH